MLIVIVNDDMAKTMPFITDWAMEDVTITSCPGGVSECEHSDNPWEVRRFRKAQHFSVSRCRLRMGTRHHNTNAPQVIHHFPITWFCLRA